MVSGIITTTVGILIPAPRSYDQSRQFADPYSPRIRELIGATNVSLATDEQDRKEATDMLEFVARNLRYACRVRGVGYAADYPNDFTLRFRRDNGTKTEFAKIMEGWADRMFYGHATGIGIGIYPWMIIDLDVFREVIENEDQYDPIKWGKKNSGDGTWFAWYDASSFPSNLIVARSKPPVPPALDSSAGAPAFFAEQRPAVPQQCPGQYSTARHLPAPRCQPAQQLSLFEAA